MTRRATVLFAMLVMLSLPAVADEVADSSPMRGAVMAGLGAGHDLLGIQLEFGIGHWSGFAASSVFRGLNVTNSFAAGARWSMRPDGTGFGVALQAWVWKSNNGYPPETTTVLAATAHWRWKWGFFIVDAGIGPALSIDNYRYDATDFDEPSGVRGRNQQKVCFGILTDLGSCGIPFDVELGVGVGF